MATAKTTTAPTRPIWLKVGLVLLLAAVVLAWFYRVPIQGYAGTGAAVAARTTCSCRYVAGRGLGDCEKDFEPGMEVVFLSENEEERSVTAYVPLVASETARFREGYGCVLEPWDE
jgi:hypothetical protein